MAILPPRRPAPLSRRRWVTVEDPKVQRLIDGAQADAEAQIDRQMESYARQITAFVKKLPKDMPEPPDAPLPEEALRKRRTTQKARVGAQRESKVSRKPKE